MGIRDQVRSRFQVAREMGDELLVPCPHPDHHDRNPSASINISKRLWVCYSCGKGGRLETLLGDRIEDPEVEDLLMEISSSLAGYGSVASGYSESWLDQFDAGGVHPYWLRRGVSEELCRKFRLGYDMDTDRVTYPLRGPSGAVLGVVGRAIGAKLPKYRYPDHAPVSETLFAYYLVREGVKDIVLTEGALDAIAMWDVDVPAVAQMGARLSDRQVQLLRELGPRTITLAYDQDDAGRKAVERAKNHPGLDFCLLRVMTWDPEDGKDPLELSSEERLRAYERARVV